MLVGVQNRPASTRTGLIQPDVRSVTALDEHVAPIRPEGIAVAAASFRNPLAANHHRGVALPELFVMPGEPSPGGRTLADLDLIAVRHSALHHRFSRRAVP